MTDTRPVCVPCNERFRAEKNGVAVAYTEDAVFEADMYQCPGCGHQIVVGFADRPIERWQHGDEMVDRELDRAIAGPGVDMELLRARAKERADAEDRALQRDHDKAVGHHGVLLTIDGKCWCGSEHND